MAELWQTNPTASAPSYAPDWMVEHLEMMVPLCMTSLHAAGRRPSLLLETYADRVRAELARQGRNLSVWIGGAEQAKSVASIIGAAGDSSLGGSKIGRAAAVADAMAWGIAATALLTDGGVDYHGAHWCARGHDGCPRQAAAVDLEVSA